MLKRFMSCFSLTVSVLCICSSLRAETLLPSGRDSIVPDVNILNTQKKTFALSLITTFQLLTKQSILLFNNEIDAEKVNFFYASGEDFIVDGNVSISAIPIFDLSTQADISKLETKSETCYVQGFTLQSGQHVTTVIHNEDNDFAEDVFRCLVAGLWQYANGNMDDWNASDWRLSFKKLIDLNGG